MNVLIRLSIYCALLSIVCLFVCAITSYAESTSGDRTNRLRDITSEWEVHDTPVLGSFHNLYNPKIIEDTGEYRYKMWFFGWAVADNNPVGNGKFLGDAIYHARSKNLLNWEVYSGKDSKGKATWDITQNPKLWVPVMSVGRKPFDNMANGDPSVVKRNGIYYMVFSSVGFDTQGEHMYIVNCVMGATSADGIAWKKTASPILIWDKEFQARWDIAGGNFSRLPAKYYGSYHRPSLLFDKGRWKIWFDYYCPGTFLCMGYAENKGDFTNPKDWLVIRAEDSPLLRDWPNPSVVRIDDTYYSFSDAPYAAEYQDKFGNDGRLTTMAESHDGLIWHIVGCLRPNGMEASHVPEAFVHKDKNGTWLYVFYSWKPVTQPGQENDYRYKQIRFMRRLIKPSDK